jgi:hypothetical protein
MNRADLYGTWEETSNDDQPPGYSFVMNIQPDGVVVSRLSYTYQTLESSTEWMFEEPDWFITTFVGSNPDDPNSLPMREVTRRRILKASETELVLEQPKLEMVSCYRRIA